MSIDAIYVHVEEGGKHGKVKDNVVLETDDCLWVVHESWCHVKSPALNRQPLQGQETQGHFLAPSY